MWLCSTAQCAYLPAPFEPVGVPSEIGGKSPSTPPEGAQCAPPSSPPNVRGRASPSSGHNAEHVRRRSESWSWGSAPGSLVSKPRGAATADRARLASSSAAASKRALVAAAAAVSRQIQPSQDAQTHGFGSAIPRGGPLTALPALAASASTERLSRPVKSAASGWSLPACSVSTSVSSDATRSRASASDVGGCFTSLRSASTPAGPPTLQTNDATTLALDRTAVATIVG